MAQVIFMKQSRPSSKDYKGGDPVDILEDGAELGLKVDPATNPNSSFQIVDVPGVPASNLKFSKERGFGPEVLNLLTFLPESSLIKKRNYSMNVNNLPAGRRSAWNAGNRFSITEPEYMIAVSKKPAGP